jgi:hypothetical protein
MNRGEVSPQVLGRTDVEHLRLAAQLQENWQPRVLGPMTLRPGSEMLWEPNGGQHGKAVPFVAQADDVAVIELTGGAMRVAVNDAIVTRNAVSTHIPVFGAVGWNASRQTGLAALQVDGTGLAIWNLNPGASCAVDCALSISSADIGVEHAVRIVVENGPIIFRVGTTEGADDLFISATLDTGTYSFAFTPTGATAYVEFATTIASENYSTVRSSTPQGYQQVKVASIAIEGAGPMVLPTPWPASLLAAPSKLRCAPSADVIFVAAPGVPQYEIVRFGVTSWSIVLYKPVKGPMNAVPGDASVKLSVPQPVGNTTLTANQPIFSPNDVGTLFRLYHWQQYVTAEISFPDTWTDAVRVTGVSSVSEVSGGSIVDISVPDRNYAVTISGTWSGTVTLSRSFDGYTTGFNPFQTFTSNVSGEVLCDYLNNEIVYYRLGVSGSGVTGNPVCTIAYQGGGGEGVCHVTGYVSPTEVEIEVLVPFTSSGTAYDWHQSEWSPAQGYPTSVAIHEGRLWWAGADRWWGSTSDDYSNFDFDQQGDSSYIDITVGQGPIADINWLLSIDNLLGGGDTQIIVARSDAIQTPLTPTNFNLRFSTTQGTAAIQAVKIDNKAIFINQSARRIFLAVYDLYTYNYKAVELSNLYPEVGDLVPQTGAYTGGGFVAMAVQRNPDTIIHLVRADGQMVSLLYDEADDVKAFWRRTTLGSYEDVIVLPGTIEDQVYVVVNRPNGRFYEKFARLDECFGDAVCKLVDCHAVYTGAATSSISAPWLAGQAIAVWANGIEVFGPNAEAGLLTLDGTGYGALPEAVTPITFGLPYKAPYLSTKLAYAAQQGTAVSEKKRVDHIGFVLHNTHCQGLRYGAVKLNPVRNGGTSFLDTLAPIDDLPLVEQGMEVPANTIWADYDFPRMEWSGDTDTDCRIYLEAASPRPATVVALTFSIESNG